MKTIISSAVLALISDVNAIELKGKPNVFGPNGTDYDNKDPRYDYSRIGISITGSTKGS